MSKYLFVVHSSITLRMARAVIHENGWERDDCIFLSDRGFQLESEPVQVLDITPYFIRPVRWREKQQLFETCRTNRKQLQALDVLITSKIGSPYRLFIPHTRPYAYLAMIRHPLCLQYAFIEEGTLSYRTGFYNYVHNASALKRKLLQGIIRYCLGPGFRAFPESLSFDHPKYAGCYGISKDTFPTLPDEGKHILPPPFEHREDYAVIEHLLVTGPWIEKGYCSISEYQTMKRALFRYWIGEGIATLYVKFHPQQYHEQISIPVFRDIAKAFADRIQVIELPPEAAPEEIAYSSQADFYLAYSSTTIYARQFGCRVFSYAKPMRENWPAFRNFFDHLPPVITENMILLDFPLQFDGNK
ncbi:MAG: polysialyltransferase family glycosyltransferase [Saprospiraceae bacterium]|nr:hypothetical protein [Lewinella sp.]